MDCVCILVMLYCNLMHLYVSRVPEYTSPAPQTPYEFSLIGTPSPHVSHSEGQAEGKIQGK
jgi:hypothetical protein